MREIQICEREFVVFPLSDMSVCIRKNKTKQNNIIVYIGSWNVSPMDKGENIVHICCQIRSDMFKLLLLRKDHYGITLLVQRELTLSTLIGFCQINI